VASASLAAQRGPVHGVTGLPAEVLLLACAPTMGPGEPATAMRITGGQDSFARRSHAPSDLVTINAGTRQGIAVGQQFFVRRPLVSERDALPPGASAPIRTKGWITVWAVDDTMSLATITHACDTIDIGDYLEPFVMPQVAAPAARQPNVQRENYGLVMPGQDRRRTFGKGDYLIVDRGSEHGVAAGSQFVLYRDKRVAENFLFELGEAVAVDVKPTTSTLQVTVSLDAIQTGDYVAMRQ
jgi:hypothetical protein